MGKFTDRTGETHKATNGQLMTIVAYRSNIDMDIMFEDGTIVYNKTYSSFLKGKIKNPNIKVSKYAIHKGKSKPCVVFGTTYESFKKLVKLLV